jgi:RimJ/RimL family protein N-acetyltransferase
MLRLRPYKKSDAKYLLNWINDERLFSMWSANKFQYPLTEAQLEKFKEKIENDENGWITIAIDEKGTPVGHFLMISADYVKNSIHMGFIVVDPEIRGKGYGKEMVELATKYAFEILKFSRITLNVFDTNPSAHNCYKKVGFVDENYIEKNFPYKDELWGTYYMAIEMK